MQQQTIIYLTEIDRAREHGLPWTSVDAARWDYRRRQERGTAAAFVRIGSRVAVYPDLTRRRCAASRASVARAVRVSERSARSTNIVPALGKIASASTPLHWQIVG